jgi:hypothetical protein
MDATANNAIIVLRNIAILRHRFIAPNQGRALDVGIVLENRYQLRRLRYSTLREPRLIKFKFSERVNDSQAAPLPPLLATALYGRQNLQRLDNDLSVSERHPWNSAMDRGNLVDLTAFGLAAGRGPRLRMDASRCSSYTTPSRRKPTASSPSVSVLS